MALHVVQNTTPLTFFINIVKKINFTPLHSLFCLSVAPSIPSSLSVRWGSDGVRVFSVQLIGGYPNAELLWAAGGTTFSKVLSKEKEKINNEGKIELKSVCAVVKSTGQQESRRGTHSKFVCHEKMRPNVNKMLKTSPVKK